jgi:hypothetical protein
LLDGLDTDVGFDTDEGFAFGLELCRDADLPAPGFGWAYAGVVSTIAADNTRESIGAAARVNAMLRTREMFIQTSQLSKKSDT